MLVDDGKKRDTEVEVRSITCEIEPVPPFRLDLTVWILKRRPEYVIDDWDGETYRRLLRIGNRLTGIEVRQVGPPSEPSLHVRLAGTGGAPEHLDPIVHEIEQLLGTDVDLTSFYQLAQSDDRLAQLANRFRGAKPVRYPSMFECLTNAITCQLVSLNVGLRVVSRLVTRYGERIHELDAYPPAFPTPRAIAGATPEELRAIGFSWQKARALIGLALRIDEGTIDLDVLPPLEDRAAVERLTAIKGVGRWTAEYALLRGLGRVHVFPGDDVGARNTLEKWLASDERLDYAEVRRKLARWSDYAGLIYFHMLLLGIESKGRIAPPG